MSKKKIKKLIAEYKPSHSEQVKQTFRQFIVVMIVVLVPVFSLFVFRQVNFFIAEIKQDSQTIYNEFEQAAKRALIEDFDSAAQGFSKVQNQLTDLEASVWFISDFKDLISAANQLTMAIAELTKLAPRLENIPRTILEINQGSSSRNEELEILITNLQSIQSQLTQVKKIIKGFPTFPLNEQQLKQFDAIVARLDQIDELLNKYQNYLPAARVFLGYELPHRYLILLQNNNELRPGGGFIGSFIIADMNDGRLSKFQPYDVYEFDGQLTLDESAPRELLSITDRAAIRDSNITPDFTTNALESRRLLEAAGGPSVDTIIAVNQSVIEDLLEATGPISLGPGKAISAENFSFVFTYITEAQKLHTDQPKANLFEFIPLFQSVLTEQNDKWGEFISIIRQNVTSKNIMAYSLDSIGNPVLLDLGLNNNYPETEALDELLITHTSVGGNKSDRFIKPEYKHETEVSNKGEIINHLTITLEHTYSDLIESQISSILRPFGISKMADPIRYVLGRGDNVTRLKIYVPEGVEFIKVDGLDAGEEFTSKPAPDLIDRHLFSYVLTTKPGQSKSVTISYKLPSKLKFKPLGLYQFKINKAAGVNNAKLIKTYKLVEGMEIKKTQPLQPLLTDEAQYRSELTINSDQLYQAIILD